MSGFPSKFSLVGHYQSKYGRFVVAAVRLLVIVPISGATLLIGSGLGEMGVVHSLLGTGVVMWVVNGFVPCPRCLKPFATRKVGWYQTGNPFALKCVNCGRPMFSKD